MKKAYIVPGYGATPHDHWFQTTANKLRDSGIPTQVIEFPSPQTPSLAAWLECLRSNLKDLDKDTIIIAHSLGCITALHFLASLRPTPHIRGLLLVSPFAEKLPNLPQLDAFTQGTINLAKVKLYADLCSVLVSDNDAIVPPEATHRFAESIGVHTQEIKSGGHFLAADGYTSFPALLDIVLTLE